MARDGHVVADDGIRIAFRDHGGGGRPLVLLHGGGANLVSMDQWAERLGGTRRTVAMDIRACGQSDDPTRFRLRDAAGDVEVLVDDRDGVRRGSGVVEHRTGDTLSVAVEVALLDDVDSTEQASG